MFTKWNSLILILILLLIRITLHLRIANRVGEDSRCRGSIVHIRGGSSCELLERRSRPKALWRFRASTSNSLACNSCNHVQLSIFVRPAFWERAVVVEEVL